MSRIIDTNLNSYDLTPDFPLEFENSVTFTTTTTFVVPPTATAVKFIGVGGGQAGTASTGGPGGGYFEKTFYAPFTGITTSFILTVGAAGGNSTLAYSNGTVIATAYGAGAISGTNPVGVGGTSGGGDVNSNGSPGGTSPGVGGAAGGPFGDGVYNATYAGRWVHYNESFNNQNMVIYKLLESHANGTGNLFDQSSLNSFDVSGIGTVGGFGGGGPAGGVTGGSAVAGGGGGGKGSTTPGNGGAGAFIVDWTSLDTIQ
jgi:hypothetical protein